MQQPNQPRRPEAGSGRKPPAPQRESLRMDADVYGDEADLPRRPRPAGAKPRPKAASGDKKARSKPKKRRLGRPLFAIATSSDESRRFRGIVLLGRTITLKSIVFAAAAVAMAVLVVMSNGNLSVDATEVSIVGLSGDLEGYRLLVLSDLNGRRFGDMQSGLLRSIGSTGYDAVFLLGDMVGRHGDPEPLYELLEGLPSSKPVYFICGDNDPGPYVETPRDITGTLGQIVLEDWILGCIERGATYVDSPVEITVGQSSLWVTPAQLLNMDAAEMQTTWKDQAAQEEDGVLNGLEADYESLPVTTYRYRIARRFYNSVENIAEEDFVLCLSHEVPSDSTLQTAAAYTSASDKFLNVPELVLAGHYCGGVWRLPLLGAFYIPDPMLPRSGWFPEKRRVEGLSSLGVTQTYITTGLSTNGDLGAFPFRLFNPPQVSVLTLTATLPENMLQAN